MQKDASHCGLQHFLGKGSWNVLGWGSRAERKANKERSIHFALLSLLWSVMGPESWFMLSLASLSCMMDRRHLELWAKEALSPVCCFHQGVLSKQQKSTKMASVWHGQMDGNAWTNVLLIKETDGACSQSSAVLNQLILQSLREEWSLSIAGTGGLGQSVLSCR